MSLIRYTHPAMALQQQLNRMFDQFDTSLFGRMENLGEGMFAPAVDIKEDAEAYTVQFEVPGIPQDNLDVSLQDNVLTIRGIKEQKQESNEGRYRRIECNYGTFARSLALPRNVDGSNVSAHLEDGVLEVRLPKRSEARPRQINVGMTQPGGQTVDVDNVLPAQVEAASGPAETESGNVDNSETVAVKSAGTSTSSAKSTGAKGTSKKAAGSGAKTSAKKSGSAKAAGSDSEDAPAGNPS